MTAPNPDLSALARDLLERAHEALADAAIVASGGGSARGAALRAADAALLGARALLAPSGLVQTEAAAVALLFDRRLVAADAVTKACGEAVHRALRARREGDEADVPALFYPARVQSLRDGAAALLAEADIILGR